MRVTQATNAEGQHEEKRKTMNELRYKPWTDYEDDELRRMHAEHTPRKEIARRMYRTESSIEHRKKKLGLHRVLYTDDWHARRRTSE